MDFPSVLLLLSPGSAAFFDPSVRCDRDDTSFRSRYGRGLGHYLCGQAIIERWNLHRAPLQQVNEN
jgi:hypothetical protein